MSKKKRTLILLLALLPLTVGSAIVATLANGSRSAEVTPIPTTATPEVTPTATEEGEGSWAIQELPQDALLPPETMPAPREREPRSTTEEPKLIESSESSQGPMLASVPRVEPSGDVVRLAEVGSYARQPLYRYWGTSRGALGGGGGGSGAGGGSGSESSVGGTESSGGGSESSGTGPGDVTPSDADTNENTNPPAGTNEDHETRTQPSEDPKQGSNDENDGPGTEAGLNPPQTEHDEPGSSGEDESGEGPTEEDPVYIPPETTNPPVVQVPEPATIGLLGLGLLGCAFKRRKKVS